jgi:predicted nuclease of predicted toxin-antitoxin system
VKFLVDNQLLSALAQFLRDRGFDAIHVLEIGRAQARDVDIWSLAIESGRIVISKDRDFVDLAESLSTGRLFLVKLGNCRTEALLKRFEQALPEIREAFAASQRIVEIR